MLAATDVCQLDKSAERPRCGRAAERHDNGVLQKKVDLAVQPRAAVGDLLPGRGAVAGRPAFQDVDNSDAVAVEADVAQQFVEQHPCPSDEWQTARVLGRARRLTDEDESSCRGRYADDDVRTTGRQL
jgi:hypothetical protein